MATRLIVGFFHCAPSSVQDLLENERHRLFKHDTLTDYLETISQKLSYEKWYFGHYHDNKNLTEKDNLLYYIWCHNHQIFLIISLFQILKTNKISDIYHNLALIH